MGKRPPPPPAAWAWIVSGAFLLVALGVIVVPMILGSPAPPADDPNVKMQAVLGATRRLSLVRVKGAATLRTIDDAEEIRRILASIVVVSNPPGKLFQVREEPKYKLVFDGVEVQFISDEFLRAPFWASDHRLTPASMKILWDLINGAER